MLISNIQGEASKLESRSVRRLGSGNFQSSNTIIPIVYEISRNFPTFLIIYLGNVYENAVTKI